MSRFDLRRGAAQPRLAIIGCGSSGLISLKTALAELPDWEVVCFEKSNRITGCWGNPYPGFVSTSTRYTTQFACFPERDASVEPDAGRSRAEFFRNAEYGEYLNRFADAFQLRGHIRLEHDVASLTRDGAGGWLVRYRDIAAPEKSAIVSELFHAVIICTGLVAEIKQIESAVPAISLAELNAPNGISSICNQRIVIFGGGESAVDYATRLSQPELGNEVYLSLRTGIRVSPRYHPIRGVPSDFLRNRLMLSIHPDMRNWIGQRFVEARILHQERFEKLFPWRRVQGVKPLPLQATDHGSEQAIAKLRKEWAYRLTKAAKDELFNMFHNKSDDFLDHVARGRIKMIGPPVDSSMESFTHFQSDDQIEVRPTKILPAIGYRSTLGPITGDSLRVPQFYLGCCHAESPDTFLVGFARPIIGNIPTICEMQAEYVCGVISGRFERPDRIVELNAIDQQQNASRFAKLNLDALYPVEMFSYCDLLAQQMQTYPTAKSVGSLRQWWRMQLAPATTAHYLYRNEHIRRFFEQAPVYMPALLIVLLLLLKPVDWTYRFVQWLRGKTSK